MNARMRYKKSWSSQYGFTALEMLVVLIVTVAALGLGAQYISSYADNLANQSTAEHQKSVSDAAVRYIKDHYAEILEAAGPAAPAVITVPMLKRAGYLSAAFSDQNPFGQEYRILALKPVDKKLETLIVSTGGETISELGIRRIAQLMGARGGFISSTDVAHAQGSYGGWQMPLSNYQLSPGAGHLATALFFDDAALTSDYLYRNAVAGHPELNQMNTTLDMGGHDVMNGGWVRAQEVTAEGEIRAKGEMYAQKSLLSYGGISDQHISSKSEIYAASDIMTDGWLRTRGDGGWYNEKWQGGWGMSDPDWVRAVNGKSVFSGGHIVADQSLQAKGRVSAGEYLQLGGIANLGGQCWPDGLVGRSSANGKDLLVCQSGLWQSQSSFTFTGWQPVGPLGYAVHSGLLVATSCFNCPLTGYTSGVERFAISQRDKYGQGRVSGTMPIMRGESWQIAGAEQVWLMSFGD